MAPDQARGDSVRGRTTGATEWMTPEEASRVLGVTRQTLTRWARTGRITAMRTLGGHHRYSRAEIDRVAKMSTPLVGSRRVAGTVSRSRSQRRSLSRSVLTAAQLEVLEQLRQGRLGVDEAYQELTRLLPH